MKRKTVVTSKVFELVDDLTRDYPRNAEVLAYDADAGKYMPITGYLYDPTANTIMLQTDDNS